MTKNKRNIDISSATINESPNKLASSNLQKHRKRKTIVISLYEKTLEKIELLINLRKVKTTRQTWIEEAVIEKLDKDEFS